MTTPTVFVVDDDEGSRNSIDCLFGVHGIQCETFESAEAFLEGRTEQPVGCIVTDLNMPGMSGLDLYQKTLEMGWSVPTIMVTAFGEVASCVRAFKSGILDYLEKPVPTEALISRVKECLAVSQHACDLAIANQTAKTKLKKLTNKENEVLELLVNGNSEQVFKQYRGIDSGFWRNLESKETFPWPVGCLIIDGLRPRSRPLARIIR